MLRQARQLTSRPAGLTRIPLKYAQKATLLQQNLELSVFGELIINQLIAGTGRDPGDFKYRNQGLLSLNG